MESTLILNSVAAVIGTLLVALFVCTFLPGIERKYIQARIQQRIGPPVTSPGLMAPIKFFFKESITPNSPMPGLYNKLPIIGLLAVLLILIILMPQMYFLGAFASIISVVGLLKIEEIVYVFMGSLSKSVMSMNMPFPDDAKGGKQYSGITKSFLEDISANRAFKLIAFGSIPLYLALFVPVVKSGSLLLSNIVLYQQIHGPILFSFAGVIGAIVYFIGYMILLNEYPFAILKTKADVIEGPYMEYAANSRAFVFISRGCLMFTLAALFSLLFIGLPPNICSLGILVNILVAIIFPVIMAILSAFSPVFTYKQFYPVVVASSLLGVLAIIGSFF